MISEEKKPIPKQNLSDEEDLDLYAGDPATLVEWKDVKKILDERLENYRKNPGSAITHEQFIQKLKAKGML